MDQMNTKPTVIEGWISENVVDSKIAIAFKPGEKYFTADVPASLVIDDKAVPLSVVVEMMREVLSNEILTRGDDNQYPYLSVETSDIRAIAAKYNVPL